MTNVNKTDLNTGEGLKKRLRRRSLLKAGAIVAPVALTLHGGIPLAHADSAGQCVLNLVEIAQGNDSRARMLQIPVNGGQIATPPPGGHKPEILAEDYQHDPGTVLEPFNASQLHWEFLAESPGRYGFSCVSSIGFNSYSQISNDV